MTTPAAYQIIGLAPSIMVPPNMVPSAASPSVLSASSRMASAHQVIHLAIQEAVQVRAPRERGDGPLPPRPSRCAAARTATCTHRSSKPASTRVRAGNRRTLKRSFTGVFVLHSPLISGEAVRVPGPRGEGKVNPYAPSHVERRRPNCWVEGRPVHVFGSLLSEWSPTGPTGGPPLPSPGPATSSPNDRTSNPCLIVSPGPGGRDRGHAEPRLTGPWRAAASSRGCTA
jgi:hypothetical protein